MKEKMLLVLFIWFCLQSFVLSADDLYRKLDTLHREKRYSDAVELAKHLIKKQPQNIIYKLKLAELYIELDRVKEATTLLENLKSSKTNCPDVRTWLGIAYIRTAASSLFPWVKMRYFNKSIDELTFALKLFPEHLLGNFVLGRIYSSCPKFMGKLQTGIHHLEKSVSIGENMANRKWHENKILCEAYYFLAVAYREVGDLKQAKKYYKKVLNNYQQLYPDFPFLNELMKEFQRIEKKYIE